MAFVPKLPGVSDLFGARLEELTLSQLDLACEHLGNLSQSVREERRHREELMEIRRSQARTKAAYVGPLMPS